jgi:peptidoglycan/xylan/chitin deacetylase (PgdA/CDA1 family)
VPGYAWPEGKRSAFLFSVDVDIESPLVWRTRASGVRGRGELEQRRFGARTGLDRLLDLLDAHRLQGSFFVPALDAESHPRTLPSIHQRGHDIGLHGYAHERVDDLSDAENAAVLDRSLAVFERQLGLRPVGYRSPAWEVVDVLPDLLRERGIRYDSSLMGYDHPYAVDGLTEIPVNWLTDDAIYFKFTGGGADHWHPPDPAAILHAWLEEWEGIHEFGGLFTLTVHPWISGRAQRVRLLRNLLEHVRARDDVWFATAAQLAQHHETLADRSRFDVNLSGPPPTT